MSPALTAFKQTISKCQTPTPIVKLVVKRVQPYVSKTLITIVTRGLEFRTLHLRILFKEGPGQRPKRACHIIVKMYNSSGHQP